MLSVTFLGLGKKKSSAPASAAERYALAAQEAMERGDPAEAVEYYRVALEYAPLSRELRHGMAEALLERSTQSARRKGRSKEDIKRTALLPPLEEDDEPARPQRRRKAQRAPQQPAPKRRKSESATAVAEPPRRRGRPGMAEQDEAEAFDDEEFEMPESDPGFRAALQRSAAGRALERARRAKPSAARSSRRRSPLRRGRMMLLAVAYGGALLVAAGLAHGMISRALTDDALPEAPPVAVLPEELSLKLQEAGLLLSARQPEEALEMLEPLATEWPQHLETIDAAIVDALRARGSELLRERDFEAAADAFDRATRREPLNRDNWIDLGRALRESGRSAQAAGSSEADALLRRAEAAYQQALEIAKDDPAALYGLGQVYVFQSQRTQAVKTWRQLVDKAPNSPEARRARGQLEQLTGRG